MADLTKAVAQSHQEAPHQTGHSAKEKKRKPVQSVAKKFADVLKYDPAQPRDAEGQFASSGGAWKPKRYEKVVTPRGTGHVVGFIYGKDGAVERIHVEHEGGAILFEDRVAKFGKFKPEEVKPFKK